MKYIHLLPQQELANKKNQNKNKKEQRKRKRFHNATLKFMRL
jgi:hypothetical protein